MSLINFKVKLRRQRLFFFLINEHYVGGSNFFERCKHGLKWVVWTLCWVFQHTHTHTHTHTYIYIYINTHIHKLCRYISYLLQHIYIHIYTHTHTCLITLPFLFVNKVVIRYSDLFVHLFWPILWIEALGIIILIQPMRSSLYFNLARKDKWVWHFSSQ